MGIPVSGLSARFKSQRPPAQKRKFTSRSVESVIHRVKAVIADEELAWMFENCFPNTLDTTVDFRMINDRPDTYVITGDIPAMWLRDSSAQVWLYLKLAKDDGALKNLLAGVINRQAKFILLDPYANAFYDSPKKGEWANDLTEMKPGVHERKWEFDSLCYPVRLAYGYWKTTGDTSVFTEEWQKAALLIYKTFREQQRLNGQGPYRFQRVTAVPTDTLPLSGYGNPTRKIGLIHSGFRPSDDACIYPFLIPSNLFAVTSLRQLSEIFQEIWRDTAQSRAFAQFADELEKLIQQHAVADHPRYGKVYAYEIDGFGNRLFMDDANVPSLLSLPYLDVCDSNDAVYQNTRKLVWSEDNPYFFRGEAGEGIGGPHIGLDYIWQMSIIMRGLTSNDDEEILGSLRQLKRAHAGTGFMHESFYKNNPKKFTRAWFAWANSLFGEFILKTAEERPKLLKMNL